MNKTRHSKKPASQKSKSLENIKSFLNNSGWKAKLEITEAKDSMKIHIKLHKVILQSLPEEQKMSQWQRTWKKEISNWSVNHTSKT